MRLWLLFVILMTTATTLAVADDGNSNARSEKVMTPAEAVQNRLSEDVTVEFRVGYVSLLTADQPPGMPAHLMPVLLEADAKLKNGGKFYAVLNGKLLEDLQRLVINPAEHFKARTVQLTGTIHAVEVPAAKRTDYRVVVLDLQKLRVVK